MRLPWIQIDDDAMTRGRTLARLLEIPEAHGIGLCVVLWDWALDMAPEGDLRGRIADESPASLCRAATGWAGTPEILWASFQRVGLIDATGRVKGLKRYDKVLRKRQRDRERIASGSPANRNKSPRKTETETEKKDLVEKKPRQPSAAESFWKTAQVMAAEKNPLHVAVERSPKDLNIFLKPGIDRVGASGLTLAWTAYLRDEWAAARGWPLEAFAKKWQDLLNSNPKPATATEMRRYDPD